MHLKEFGLTLSENKIGLVAFIMSKITPEDLGISSEGEQTAYIRGLLAGLEFAAQMAARPPSPFAISELNKATSRLTERMAWINADD